jgi:hypothetical protein
MISGAIVYSSITTEGWTSGIVFHDLIAVAVRSTITSLVLL